MLLTILYHCSTEYLRRGRIRVTEFHVILQKSVLFAPYSRYLWGKRKNEPSKFRSGISKMGALKALLAIIKYTSLFKLLQFQCSSASPATSWWISHPTTSQSSKVLQFGSRCFRPNRTRAAFLIILPSTSTTTSGPTSGRLQSSPVSCTTQFTVLPFKFISTIFPKFAATSLAPTVQSTRAYSGNTSNSLKPIQLIFIFIRCKIL